MSHPGTLHSSLNHFIPQCRRYAGIGSRKTPPEALALIRRIGRTLALRGLTLCSGAAPGADAAFEAGCDEVSGPKEIYLPWQRFNGHESTRFPPPEEAEAIAAVCHPNWRACSPAARLLHARNVQQVYGGSLDAPVDFVLFWAPPGEGIATGGTATAVRLATETEIPVFNLRIETIAHAFRTFVEAAEGR